MFLLFYTRYVSYYSWDIDDDEESLTLLQMYKGFKNDLDSNNCFINAVLQVILWIADVHRLFFINQSFGIVFVIPKYCILQVFVVFECSSSTLL